jgi:hypothetical protein
MVRAEGVTLNKDSGRAGRKRRREAILSLYELLITARKNSQQEVSPARTKLRPNARKIENQERNELIILEIKVNIRKLLNRILNGKGFNE